MSLGTVGTGRRIALVSSPYPASSLESGTSCGQALPARNSSITESGLHHAELSREHPNCRSMQEVSTGRQNMPV